MQSFVVWNDEIEGRMDVFYYLPEFVQLEKKIKKLTSNTLGDYIINISGGATPEKDEPEKYYADSTDDGVPFLRVQNITNDGINLEDCKHINFDTHNGMLKRSQVREGYLITKITGVGRMAVSSVAPKGFEGNINQHLVAIKTDSYQTSEILAAFLNSDIGERLACRRSTGGTRPALDYQALKTIPVAFNPAIVEIMQSAYVQKKQMEAEARRHLDSIESYVLDELGIKLPEVENKMCFVVDCEEVRGNRADVYYYQPRFEEIEKAIRKGKFEVKELRDSFEDDLVKGILPSDEEKEGNIKVLQIKNILRNGLMDISEYVTAKNIFTSKHKINKAEVIIVITGATIGKVGLWYSDEEFYLGGDMVKFTTNSKFNSYYVLAFLLSQLGQYQLLRAITGATNKHLSPNDVKKIQIPRPPIEIQDKIADEVKRRMSESERLKAEASRIIEEAKKQVEEMILSG